MKKTNNSIIKAALILGMATWVLSSCQDWLTIYPQNQVVEEDYWEDKNDLEGVRYAAYQQMCNTVMQLAQWGDMRSDSYTLNNNDGDNATKSLYTDIREGRIERDSANTYFEWQAIYQTINFCNKILQHGPEVLERDKQFTNAEWTQMKAEITGLRALNYFYLIRAFKDVPYSTKVVNNDTEVMYLGATNQLVVLDSLIADVEAVQGKARNRFSKVSDTKGLFTNPAIYTLLSDMYLWRASLRHGRAGNLNATDTVYINNVATRDSNYVVHTVRGDYQKAIDYADLAINTLAVQNDRNNGVFGTDALETIDYGLTNCNLYKNNYENFTNGTTPRLYAFSQIFGGNSEESIFELQFSAGEERKHSLNGGSTSGGIWGYANMTHLAVSSGALSAINSNSDELNRDSRLWFSAWQQVIGESMPLPALFCFKWTKGLYTLQVPTSHKCSEIKVMTGLSSDDCNWIIYRLSDAMLQKAEALAVLNQSKEGEAMEYVNAIHRRWYCNDRTGSTVQPGTTINRKYCADATKNDIETMGNAPTPNLKAEGLTKCEDEIAVLNERQLEFLGEGKRWFDLVRFAERHAGGPDGTKDVREWSETNDINNGYAGVKMMSQQFLTNEYGKIKAEGLVNHIKNRYGLYNLIYYKEIKAGQGMLEQNPVWNKSIYD